MTTTQVPGQVLGSDEGLTVSSQGIHEMSSTQRYRLGTRWRRGDRVFHYAKAGATLKTDYLAHYYDYQVSDYAAVPTATPAGSRTVYATVGATHGVAANGAVAAHELEGGWVVIQLLDDGTQYTTYTFQIVDNTVVAAGGGATTLTIDSELPHDCTTSAATEITGNIYSDVRIGYDGEQEAAVGRMVVGQPMAPATTTLPYLWLQTWGPTFINPQGTPGNAAYKGQLVVSMQSGSVADHNDADARFRYAQHVGCIVTRVPSGGETAGTPLIMLQISP